jgi:hypothetical protein
MSGISVPDWLRKAVGGVVRGTTVTVPTPAGPVVVDLGNPASVAAAKQAILGTRVNTRVGQSPPSPFQDVNAAVSSGVPGGWLTIIAGGLAAVFILPKLLRRH